MCCADCVEIDVAGWAVIAPEPGGADQDKVWVAPQPGADRVDQWLWKPRQTTGDGTEFAINDVAEVIASELARALGVPAAECRYAVRGDQRGLISKNVSPPRCDLVAGQVYLEGTAGYVRHSPRFDSRGRARGLPNVDEGYTLEAVEEVLDGVVGPPGWGQMTAFQVFTGYLVLDALIANTDRHPRNWSVLDPWDDGYPMIAPSYDHGRALGSGLTKLNRERRDPFVFCSKGLAKPFTPGDESLVALACRSLARSGDDEWIKRLRSISEDQLREIVKSSEHRLSEGASTFVLQVLITNQRRLHDAHSAVG